MELKKGLSALDATAVVVGTMIGTGVFLKAGIMSHQVGSAGWVLAAWVIAGLMSLIGALVYAELGGMFSATGGEYVYLKESYGDLPAFLYGWMRFWITGPGTLAAYAVGAATFLEGFWKWDFAHSREILACSFIALFSGLNCLSVRVGGTFQTVMTALKVGIMLLLSFLFLSRGLSPDAVPTDPNAAATATAFTLSGFGSAILAALWAYDGWNNLPMMSAEVQNPSRSVPRALVIGVGIVTAIYLAVNSGYFATLTFEEVLAANSSANPDALPVSTLAAIKILGPVATAVLSIIFVISALGAMNGSVMTGARVPYALAKDNLFPKFLSQLNSKAQVPYLSVLTQGALGIALALLGTFDQLTDYVIFASWISYAMCAYGVLRLRKLAPNAVRPYKVPLYPVLPLVFVLFSILLLGNTLMTAPESSGIGLLFLASGLPIYFWKHRKTNRKAKIK